MNTMCKGGGYLRYVCISMLLIIILVLHADLTQDGVKETRSIQDDLRVSLYMPQNAHAVAPVPIPQTLSPDLVPQIETLFDQVS